MATSTPETSRARFTFGRGDRYWIGCGILTHRPADAVRYSTTRGFPDFRILYLIEGGGEYVSTAGERHPLKPGSLIIRQPDIDHTVTHERGRAWSEFYMVIPPFLATSFQESGVIPSRDFYDIGIDDDSRAAIAGIIRVVQEARSCSAVFAEVCGLFEYFTRREIINSGRADDARRIEQAKNLLTRDLGRSLSMEDVARRIGMGYETFRRMFKDAVGVAPKEYRLRKKLARAETLLMDRRYSVSAVSEMLGYPDVFCFSRQFRAHLHMTPREYRRMFG
ncbi:MAG: helix-turn-helix transcriptional regulator [Spirochaetes bacterium]|nr:helix-turn-helix transcriptional regulator [Spirochaetota bacterium]